MVAPGLMDKFQPLQDGEGYLKELLLCKSLVLSFFEQVEQSTIGTVFHQNDEHLIFCVSASNGHQISTIACDQIFTFWKPHLHAIILTMIYSSSLANFNRSFVMQTTLFSAYFCLVWTSSASQMKPNDPYDSNLSSWMALPLMLYF